MLFKDFDICSEHTVVDIGCGDGGAANFCARQNAKMIISDVDAEKVSALKKELESLSENSVTAYVSNSDPLPMDDEIADRTIALEVLEHVNNPAAVMSEIVRVTKPDGKFLLSVPSESSEELQRGIAPRNYFKHPNHIHTFSETEFVDLLK